MIGKREKARRYAEERDRIQFHSFDVTMNGENNSHRISFENGIWQCDCDFFRTRNLCSHTMALEIILESMLVEPVNS